MSGIHITGTVEALAANIINAATHVGVHDSIRAAQALADNGLLHKPDDVDLTATRNAYIDAHALHACVSQYQPEFAAARSAHVAALRAAQTNQETT